MPATPIRYQVRSEYDALTQRDLYWVFDLNKHVRVGPVSFVRGRIINRATDMQIDWESIVDRLGLDHAIVIHG